MGKDSADRGCQRCGRARSSGCWHCPCNQCLCALTVGCGFRVLDVTVETNINLYLSSSLRICTCLTGIGGTRVFSWAVTAWAPACISTRFCHESHLTRTYSPILTAHGSTHLWHILQCRSLPGTLVQCREKL